jgi:hypothetical protein
VGAVTRLPQDYWWATRWAARVLGVVVVVGFIAITASDAIREGGFPYEPRDVVWFILFPVGVSTGYVIAWRRELLGSMISLVCYALLYGGGALAGERPPVEPFLWPFGAPAFLFLIHWAFSPEARATRGV